MDEANRVYMSYATDAELIVQLNELLEAERAGTRVAMHSHRDDRSRNAAEFLKRLARDEAACCTMLARHVAALGGRVSSGVGNFYESAMSIADLDLRLAFINRGQGWVVRRLKEMLPKVKCDELHADLTEMLRTHEKNITTTNRLLGNF